MGTTARSGQFPNELVEGLPPAHDPEVVELADGDRYPLTIAPVAKRIGDATVRMLAYNGSIPGPVLKVAEGSTVTIDATNRGDLEATVHWHGLRLENRYDGTHAVQRPMAVGEGFEYRLEFPDPGAYWYHPHVRQDYAQEMGLYGTIVVAPRDPDYWPPAHRELTLTLDDVLLEDGRVAPFERAHTTYSAMGRFGDHLLANGETDLRLVAQRGEVVRFYLTNTANTRVFDIAFRGARMKLVGGDSGHVEHEQLIESAIVAPSERVVVDVRFDADDVVLEHRTPERTYELGRVAIAGEHAEPIAAEAFEALRTNADMVAERERRLVPHLEREPDKVVALVAEMDFEEPEGATVFFCPMHPEVVRADAGTCPKCAMKLMPRAARVEFFCPMHPEVVRAEPGTCPKCAMKLMPRTEVPQAVEAGEAAAPPAEAHEHAGGAGHAHVPGGIEWEDDMVEVNRGTNPSNMRWKLIDRATGAEGYDIDWTFRVGDQVKIRLRNEMASDHPMHHPFHIHGAGRFLVLARDGAVEPNLVWTDTVLVLPGEELDLLLDVTHPGTWVAHCHIAEHHETGMIFRFDVLPARDG